MLRAFLCLLWITLALPLNAAGSDMAVTRTLTAQIVTAQDGVPGGSAALSAGLSFTLEPGWKTYWRSPGEVGLPPEISWEGSQNIRDIALSFPAPKRFTAFEIENFGYADAVLFPLQVQLERPGEPARLQLEATVLVCAEVCIPETVNLTLELPALEGPAGGGIDGTAAVAIAEWIAKVPDDGAGSGWSLEQVYLDESALVVLARSERPMTRPDIFPEHGEYASFGKPEIRLGDGGREIWARLPVLAPGEGPVQITLTDGARAATLPVAQLAATAPAAPQATAALLSMVLIALLGGLILNVMPCVLPVLSIKLTSALGAAGQAPGRVRAGFLASAAGVLVFFWALAGVVLAMQASGASFGWGIQFQNPVFLSLMAVVVILFAANLFGAFEIMLPQRWNTSMAQTESRGGWGGDFATGVFAALLATPCSAPFLGTAVTYALTHGPREVVVIFTALGLGLALPYLVIAARPAWLAKLPKPGRWMVWVKWAMGALLVATALWLISVLAVVSGVGMVAFVAGIALLLVLALAQGRILAGGALAAVAVAVVALTPMQQDVTRALEGWEVFDEAAIMSRVAQGETVFVDVTADWCLTCKANKSLVLERGAVAEALDAVTLMRADWTRPSDTILSYLQMNDRFGIPFNIVYGPGAPEGIALPELLTTDAVLGALEAARGAVRD
jgi:suppressor for copper-sensitivity B